MVNGVNAGISEEILSQVACQHKGCGRPLTECDGSSHLAQSARHLTLCPLCGGAAHNNDAKSVMAFRCAMRQALAEHGERFDDKSDVLLADQVRKLADWLELPGRQYGKDAAAKQLVASGVTGIAAAKVGKRSAAAAGAALPPPPPAPSTPPPAPPAPVPSLPCGKCGTHSTKLDAGGMCPTCVAGLGAPAPAVAPPVPPPSMAVGVPDDDEDELDPEELARLTKQLERLNP